MGVLKYLRPTELFTDLNKKPVYGKKMIAIAILLFLAVFARLTPQTEAQRQSISASSFLIAVITEFLIYFAFMIIAALAYYFVMQRLFNINVDFNKLFAVYVTASIAGAIGRFANATFNASLGMPASTSPYINMFYNIFDVFVVWKLVYLTIGFNIVLGIDKRRSRMLVIIMWLVLFVIAMLAAPLFAATGIAV